jgi:hypothetical protein
VPQTLVLVGGRLLTLIAAFSWRAQGQFFDLKQFLIFFNLPLARMAKNMV